MQFLTVKWLKAKCLKSISYLYQQKGQMEDHRVLSVSCNFTTIIQSINQFISHLCTTIIIKDNKKIERSDGLPEKQVCLSKLVD